VARREGAKQVLEEYQHQSLRAERRFTHLFTGRILEALNSFPRLRRVRIRRSRYIFPWEYIMPPLNVLPELLKAHRQDYMYRNFDMLEVPLMHDDVREKFSAQIMCS
jgi:hypothetical protein